MPFSVGRSWLANAMDCSAPQSDLSTEPVTGHWLSRYRRLHPSVAPCQVVSLALLGEVEMKRPFIETGVALGSIFVAFASAELYASTRGVDSPEANRRSPTRASLFVPETVFLSQEERLLVRAGRMTPFIAAVPLAASAWRRRRKPPERTE